MKPVDPRDELFSRLFEAHLRPTGFRRKSRRATRQLENGLVQRIELESSTWNTAAQLDFGINLQVSHPAFRSDPFSDKEPPEQGDLLLNISLRQQTDPPRHRWSLEPGTDRHAELARVEEAFSSTGTTLIHRMSDIASIEALCAEFGPTRYFASRAWCLRRLGRNSESADVIRAALANAPHEGFRSHAARLLARYGAL